MAESAKDVAERLAGPHEMLDSVTTCPSDRYVPGPCTCPRRERVAAIEAAIREADQEGFLRCLQSMIDAILALPLEGPGEEGR